MRFFGIGFLVLLFLEIMSIVWVADWLGGGWTLFLMAATFAAGVLMLRHTGLSGLLLAGAAVKVVGRYLFIRCCGISVIRWRRCV